MKKKPRRQLKKIFLNIKGSTKKDREKQIKTNDDLCREICRKRDKVCVHCFRSPKEGRQMDWVHYITRSNHHVRWNLDNTMMMHNGCHTGWAHKHHEQFTAFMMHKLKDRYWLLIKARNDTSKLDLKATEFCLRRTLNNMTFSNHSDLIR